MSAGTRKQTLCDPHIERLEDLRICADRQRADSALGSSAGTPRPRPELRGRREPPDAGASASTAAA